MTRPLTLEERQLIRWMLDHGGSGAKGFLTQLENAQVEPWRCPCGCASINLSIPGHEKPPHGIHPIAEFVFGDDANLSGIFAYEKGGTLAGLEIYGLSGEASKSLPSPESLRPWVAVQASGDGTR